MAAAPEDATSDADPTLAAEGLSFTPPGMPPIPTPDVSAGVLLQSGEETTPAPAAAAPPETPAALDFTPPGTPPVPLPAAAAAPADTGSHAPPPMPSETPEAHA